MAAGKQLLKKHDVARAILEFKNATKATPKDPETHYQLAIAYIQSGDVIHGVPELRKVLEINPKHQEAQLILARLMSTVDDKEVLEDARRRLESMLEDTPNNSNALHALALTELKLGNSKNALENLGKAVAAAPSNVSIAVTLAQAKLRQGDAKGAEEVLLQAVAKNPNSAPAVVILGRFYLSQRRMEDAEKQIRRALAMDGNSGSALYAMASLQLETGRKAEAEQTLRRLSQLPEKITKSAFANFLYEEGRTKEALTEFQRLIKEDPSDREARARLVTALASLKRIREAEAVLNEVLKRNPKDLDALLQRGELLVDAGKYDQAEMDLNQVLQLQPIAPEIHYVLGRLYRARKQDLRYREELSKALELNPYLLAVRLELAQSLALGNNARSALDILDKAPESQRNLRAVRAERNWTLWAAGDIAEMRKSVDASLARERTPEFLLQDGLLKLRSGNASAARVSLESALSLDPTDVRAMGALNQAFTQQNQASVAVIKVKEFAAKQPKSADVQEFLGVLLFKKGDIEGARAAFGAAKAADPKAVKADLSLAAVDVAERKYDSALNRLHAVLAANPDHLQARLWVGNVKMFKHDYNGALEAYSMAVRIDSSDPQALNNYAYLLAQESHKLDVALKYAQRAQELAPDNPEFTDTLGWILFEKGLYPSALTYLTRSGARDGNPVWKYHLAMAYAKSGDPESGRAMLKVALARNPDLPEAKVASEMLGVTK